MHRGSRSSPFVTLLLLATFLPSVLVQNAFALPISQNPDDYDIPKYERNLLDSRQEWENIRERVLGFDQRLRNLDQQIQGEQNEAAQMQDGLTRAQQVVATSVERERQLAQEIERIQAQKIQLSQELGQIRGQIEQEQRRREGFVQQIGAGQTRVAAAQTDSPFKRPNQDRVHETRALGPKAGIKNPRPRAFVTAEQGSARSAR